MKYYSAFKKNAIMPFAATWMDLEIAMLSGKLEKEKYCNNIPYIWHLKRNDLNEFIYKTETVSQT